MNIELKPFQEITVQNLLRECATARAEVAGGGRTQAVVLAAPTGSGKTIIATAVMESLFEGSEEVLADADATFLWITDQPELNEQTRKKILQTSSVFGPDRLVTLDASFDQPTLSPGRIYFLNVQKLRDGALLVTRGDGRNHTLWETVAATLEERPTSLWLVIDEAHKGMAQSTADVERAQSIIQRFLKGSDEVPSVPLVLGISATPERFLELVRGTPRLPRPEEVDVLAVRESGLLKDVIYLFHPDETQPADVTLLRMAAERLREYEERWRSYHASLDGAEEVRPILVIQVEDAGHQRPLTKTDISEAIAAIENVLGPLEPDEIAHAFQEGTGVEVDGRILRYCAPSDIQDDPSLRVVFFKMSLNSGWDCPRAEVMMSYRRAAEYTFIAQLVGRMVRTPLARSIDADEFLNTVSLYLPHYDASELQRVLDYLQNPDPRELAPSRVERGEGRVRLERNPELSACFEALSEIPTYAVTQTRKMSDIRRLIKMARSLALDDIDDSAPESARSLILDTLFDARRRIETEDSFREFVKERGVLDLRAVEHAYGVGQRGEERIRVEVTQENVDDLFEETGRRLGEGVHKLYWRARAEEEPRTMRKLAKLEVVALAARHEVMNQLENAAADQVQGWENEHRRAILGLPPDRQEVYDQIRYSARRPAVGYLSRMPQSIEGKEAEASWEKHLYIAQQGDFPYKFRSRWEVQTLEEEQRREDYVGFLRNEDRKKYSLTVPYEWNGRPKPLYPDLLVFRHDESGVVVDILDPHNDALEDWWAKAKGLAQYAEDHGRLFGRVELIIVSDGRTRRVDVTDRENRLRVQRSTTMLLCTRYSMRSPLEEVPRRSCAPSGTAMTRLPKLPTLGRPDSVNQVSREAYEG